MYRNATRDNYSYKEKLIILNMNTLDKELIACRKRWVEANRKGDQAMCNLWKRVGLSLKERMLKKFGGDANFENSEKIFK